MKKIFVGTFSAVLISLGAAEVGARIFGLVDFPLYFADNEIGYIPAPNQSGSFMSTNDWAFNERSMGTSRAFAPSEKTDILLVGDSVVLGGNPYKQAERLGPQLEKATGAAVWPISAGSWGLQNELQYLRNNPEVVSSVDNIVFVLNSGDFDAPSSWASEFTHPRERPVSALLYLFEKNVLKPSRSAPAAMRVGARDPVVDLKAFATGWAKPFDVWLYPDKAETLSRAVWDEKFQPIIARLQAAQIPGLNVHRADQSPSFSEDDYRDSIHPTSKATAKLALAIGEAL